MHTITKQKQIRGMKLVLLAMIALGVILGLTALSEFTMRQLSMLQFTDSNLVPVAIGTVRPIYFVFCAVLGVVVGKLVLNIWFAPFTTPEKEKEENAKN
jgi:hypothetical protein